MNQDWRVDAACAGMDPDIFFCRAGGNHGWDWAREVCASCPVILLCRAEALEYEGNAGETWRYSMRGGLTPSERKDLAGWAQIDRRWSELELERDRRELHLSEWAAPLPAIPRIHESIDA